MHISYAYITLLLIWSTTPLAIQWSSQGPGPLLGIMLRMITGALVCVILLMLTRQKLVLNKQAFIAYSFSAFSIFSIMSCVYWGSQFIPSGLVAVIFGLTPLFTAVTSRLILKEKSLTLAHISGIIIALLGLWLVFNTDLTDYKDWHKGFFALLAAGLLYSFSTVVTKKYHCDLPTLSITAGGLILVSLLFLICWLIIGNPIPDIFPLKAIGAILYLGILGTGIGFSVYFYALKASGPSTLTLITLVTPITALLLGATLNNEPLSARIIAGALLTMSGLAVTQYKLWLPLLVEKKESL